jgi:glyoxylase-like metal-dependent hydrolase (beta-lactamase superfamily II)
MEISRRSMRWGGSALLVALMTGAAGSALAGAPQQKTQVPGWYRTMVGDFEVTALFDGYLDLDTTLLKDTRPGEVARGMARAFQPGPKVQTSVNAFLVNTGQQLILVDAGTAKAFGPTLGFMLENLKASGYEPEQVDIVLLTHLHGDHVNGVLSPDGKIAFPNAQVMVTRPESAYWLDDAKMQKAAKEMQQFFQMAKAAAAPYQAAGRWKLFEPNAEIAPGVKAVATGHTPGHSSYLFESKGQRMLVLGDMIHVGSVQFARPEVAIKFDTDSRSAVASRKSTFAKAAKDKTLLAGAHLSFPGLGHLRAEGKGYVWVPVEFSPIRTPIAEKASAASSQ